ncbi:hypothetical protein QSI_1465 [Clostridioides difficile P28]|nr:hypothetical protein QSI_1465 [Clostridioides difficile P28]
MYISRSTRELQDSGIGCDFYMEVYPSFKLFIGIDSMGL